MNENLMGEMAIENAVNGLINETPTTSIQEDIKKMREHIGVASAILFVHAFVFRRKKERRERIALESSQEVAQTLTVMKTEKDTAEKNYVLITKHGDEQCEETFKEDRRTMGDKGTCKSAAEKKLNDRELQSEESFQTTTGMKTEKKTDEKNNVLKRKHGDQQGVETFREDVEPMTVKNSKKNSASTSALTGSVQKLDQQGKGMSDLKSVSSLQEEIETQKSDCGRPKRHVEHAIRMMKALHGSSSHDDYAIFKNLKGGFDDHFRELLFQSGAIGSTEATVEDGKKENDCVIQSLAKRLIKNLELTFFGSDTEYDPSDDLDIKTSKILERMEYYMRELFRLYLAEELDKDKMASNGTDLKRRKTENIADCDVKSSLEKEEGGKSEA
ncbi:hypothetical protein K7X08_026942 [Anisodus acutangulus]|uniref:Uncharacterized protein n=1 Tax=Anisodus acutangulus TaxID=402998 RepID=A0A9Q1QYE7_9SOLA|nr:hypothetical protein K7X08_026942 [Anisodus acutangulus]